MRTKTQTSNSGYTQGMHTTKTNKNIKPDGVESVFMPDGAESVFKS